MSSVIAQSKAAMASASKAVCEKPCMYSFLTRHLHNAVQMAFDGMGFRQIKRPSGGRELQLAVHNRKPKEAGISDHQL
jgi:hypothetical protein